MPYLLVRHRVADYEGWKRDFDDRAGARLEAGSRGGTVFHGTDAPDQVVVLLEWDEAEQADAFARSKDLWRAMGRDGVPDDAEASILEEAGDPAA